MYAHPDLRGGGLFPAAAMLHREPLHAPRHASEDSKAIDASGHAIFASGDCGVLHVLAHRCEDENRSALGRECLQAWLDCREGSGPRWVHLQFHLALFEIETGAWRSAYHRYSRQVLPAAISTRDALTDAPALAWWLQTTAAEPVDLDWPSLQRTALAALDDASDPFVTAHHLLALAGAEDASSLAAWLARQEQDGTDNILYWFGDALRSYSLGFYARAARKMRQTAPDLERLGGSGAQSKLFAKIAAFSERLASAAKGAALPAAA